MGDGPALTERISLLFVFVIDCWVTSPHTGMALNQHTSVISRFPWVGIQGSSAGASAEGLTGCSPGVSGAAVSSEARLGMDLFHAHEGVGSIVFPVAVGLRPQLPAGAGWRLPSDPCHVASPTWLLLRGSTHGEGGGESAGEAEFTMYAIPATALVVFSWLEVSYGSCAPSREGGDRRRGCGGP